MIRVAITPAAYAAIASTMALGTVAVEPERAQDGGVHIWLDPGVVATLKALERAHVRIDAIAVCATDRVHRHEAESHFVADDDREPFSRRRNTHRRLGASDERDRSIVQRHGTNRINPRERGDPFVDVLAISLALRTN